MMVLWLIGVAGLVIAGTGIGFNGGRHSGFWVLGFWSTVLVIAGVAA